jgi:serine O-acetyltransferase
VDNVKLLHQVTIGRADSYLKGEFSKMDKIVVKEGAIICVDAKILCKESVLTVGENTIIRANAVLTKSTGDNEIWSGIPAIKIGGS